MVQVTVVCLVNNKNSVGEEIIWKLKKKIKSDKANSWIQ